MRKADNEKRDGLKASSPLSPAGGDGEGHASPSASATDDSPLEGGKGGPERTCCLSGKKGPRENLIRLAISPDGTVAPDVRAKAPGRGAWIGVDRRTLEEAITKGKLAKALNRAFKTAVNVPSDLADQIKSDAEREQDSDLERVNRTVNLA